MCAGPQYLVREAEGLGQFADLTQSAEILVQSTDHLLDALLVCCLSGTCRRDDQLKDLE